MNIPYCTFEDTQILFKNKKIYRCSYCGTQLALDSPNTKILCFKKHNEIINSIVNMGVEPEKQILNKHAESEAHFQKIVQDQLQSQTIDISLNTEKDSQPVLQNKPTTSVDVLCSKEQIEERLKICNACEHFKDNSCLLCGCVVVRDKNFNNKLAHKNHSCPINKWGPVE
jgi:hypothetical protein